MCERPLGLGCGIPELPYLYHGAALCTRMLKPEKANPHI